MANYIGARTFFAAGTPATFNKAGYEALTWVEADGRAVAPMPGMETAMIEVPDLNGLTKVEKGASIGRVAELAYREIDEDLGQAAIRTYSARGYGADISVKVVLPSGTNNHIYMTGQLFGLMENPGDTETHRGFTVSFQQNYDELRTTPPA